VAKTVMPEIRIDEQLFRLLHNPGQLAALIALVEGPASKSDIAKELGIRLNKADYDVGELEKMGLVEPIGTEMRRGQRTTIYRAVMRPILNNEEWGELSQEDRERLVLWTYQLLLRDATVAWRARTLQARVESHNTRSPVRVDEQGWIRLNEILDDTQEAVREVEVESVERAREAGDESKLINVRAAMFCFEMPPGANLVN
jgi:DNA-binding transcriptional ArsR family regulator